MFFAIFWTAFIPFGMIVLSLAADWLKRSLRQVRSHALAPSTWRPIRRGRQDPVGEPLISAGAVRRRGLENPAGNHERLMAVDNWR
jgi:hypothetical protein